MVDYTNQYSGWLVHDNDHDDDDDDDDDDATTTYGLVTIGHGIVMTMIIY